MTNWLVCLAAACALGQTWVLQQFSMQVEHEVTRAMVLRANLQRSQPKAAAAAFCADATEQKLCKLLLQTRADGAWVDTCAHAPQGYANRYWRIALNCELPTWFGSLHLQRPHLIELLD